MWHFPTLISVCQEHTAEVTHSNEGYFWYPILDELKAQEALRKRGRFVCVCVGGGGILNRVQYTHFIQLLVTELSLEFCLSSSPSAVCWNLTNLNTTLNGTCKPPSQFENRTQHQMTIPIGEVGWKTIQLTVYNDVSFQVLSQNYYVYDEGQCIHKMF